MLREPWFLLGALASLVACSGTVEHVSGDEAPSGGSSGVGGAAPSIGGSGGAPSGGAGGGVTGGAGGTGGKPYEDPGCPDREPPPPHRECDPLDPWVGCQAGYGCYPYVSHPYGSGCGFQQFGAVCQLAGTGMPGDKCGDGAGGCAPGHMCVVGAGAGKRCQKICGVQGGDSDCPPGLVCGETDIQGYGVCF